MTKLETFINQLAAKRPALVAQALNTPRETNMQLLYELAGEFKHTDAVLSSFSDREVCGYMALMFSIAEAYECDFPDFRTRPREYLLQLIAHLQSARLQ